MITSSILYIRLLRLQLGGKSIIKFIKILDYSLDVIGSDANNLYS
jgi:hypothetical protein